MGILLNYVDNGSADSARNEYICHINKNNHDINMFHMISNKINYYK